MNTRKIKILVLITFTSLTAVFFIADNNSNHTVIASEGGAPTARTGAPGETTCTSCHTQNSGSGQFVIQAPANYTPGQTYQIQVQHTTSDTSRQNWGFETISLAGSAMAGSFANLNANTRIRTSGTKSYMTQTTAGTFANQTGGATWTFNWTAPATNVGTVTFYAAGLQGDNSGDEDGDFTLTATATVQPQATVVIHHGFSDFDGDGKADPSVFRPSDNFWYVNRSTQGFTAVNFGLASDKFVPADFDGDDKTDIAVWREAPATEAAFYILNSSNNTLRIAKFGQTGDIPLVVGDWDGDGKADPAVYRNAASGNQSYFFYQGSNNNPLENTTYLPWGTSGDKPMRGDFDGDGKFDPAIFRPSNQTWYILQTSNNQLRVDYWGLASDKFIPADYDGDLKTDLAVFRNGVWYIKQSSNGTSVYYNWGLASDMLVPADYDGDAKTDAAIYRNGVWYIRTSATGNLSIQNFGSGADVPIPGVFVQ